MANDTGDRSLPSLTSTTLRRGLVTGRIYLILGVAISLPLTITLLSRKSALFATIFPTEVPIFASLGAMGALMIFVSDRSKGVYEYLIAYGLRPSRLFLNILLTAVGLAGIVLGAILAVGVGGYLVDGLMITANFRNALLGYTIPMTFASALFAAIGGMVWTSLSTPRTGLNSPVGFAPMLGVAPPVLVLIVTETYPASDYYYITTSVAAAFLVLVAVMLVLSSRLMRQERFLSQL